MTYKGKILVVDDTPASLKLLTDLLKAEGYRVRSAIDGELALHAALSNPPDLVLLDIRMPGIDGYEVCRRLKTEPKTQDVPVIFVSAASETGEKVHGFEIGAVDYVTKPYQRDEILARVRTHLELSRLRNRLEELVEERTADLKASEQKLRESEALFRTYFNLGRVGMAFISVDRKWLKVNHHLCEMLGYSSEELRKMTWMEITHLDDLETDYLQFIRLLSGEIEHYALDKRFIQKNGNIIYTHLSMSCQRKPDQSVEYVMASLEDISERKKMEDLIRQMAFCDSLTQLPNRRLLNDRLECAMTASQRSDCYGAVIFLDLDNFKQLNDEHGHHAGDLLLVEVAQRLAGCVRKIDTVSRFGGDEFIVLLNELNIDEAESIKQALMVAEKIHVTLSNPYRLIVQQDEKPKTTLEYHCPCTIGVALFKGHKTCREDLFKYADRAMYQAKENGRNCIQLYGAKN